MQRLFLSAILSLAVITPGYAASSASIGYVDMQKVLEDSKVGKRVQDQLRKEFEPRAKGLGEEERQIRKDQQEFERDKALMSKDQVAKKEKDLQTRIEAYQKKAAPIQQELVKAQQQKAREVIGPAREAVNAIAKKNKLGMVVERNQAGLIYIDEGLDITADVIKQLDSKAE